MSLILGYNIESEGKSDSVFNKEAKMQTIADVIPLLPFYPGLLRRQGLRGLAVVP